MRIESKEELKEKIERKGKERKKEQTNVANKYKKPKQLQAKHPSSYLSNSC